MFIITSLQRLTALAATTFIQLVRMKVFLFLLFFLILFLGANTLRFSDILGPETEGGEQLTLMKESTLGVMRLFCLIFSICATALLIPRDGEDRIIYTILCKPVPRWEYLAGKLLGVMAVIFTVVVCMDVLFSLVLEWRIDAILLEEKAHLSTLPNLSAEEAALYLDRIAAKGATINLQLGIATLILESLLLCSITLLLSVFSTSTIFSIVIAFCIYVVGLFQEEIRNLLFGSLETGTWQQTGRFLLSIIFPDFRMFSIMDSAISGKTIPAGIFGKIAGITIAYMVMYLSVASLIFKRKEF